MAQINPISGIDFFMPIISFLFVWIVIYALIIKTGILGKENKAISIAISLILAVFFIVNLNMRNFLNFNAAWVAVFAVCLFFIVFLITFTHGKIDVIMKPWIAWIMLTALVLFFIISSTYFFSWTLNWNVIWDWFDTQWFGFVLLLIVAGIVSWVLGKN